MTVIGGSNRQISSGSSARTVCSRTSKGCGERFLFLVKCVDGSFEVAAYLGIRAHTLQSPFNDGPAFRRLSQQDKLVCATLIVAIPEIDTFIEV